MIIMSYMHCTLITRTMLILADLNNCSVTYYISGLRLTTELLSAIKYRKLKLNFEI